MLILEVNWLKEYPTKDKKVSNVIDFSKHNLKKVTIKMPLKKSTSKEAFKANVKAELEAGKKPAQAVAIAYSEKREAAKKSTTKGKK